MTDPERNQLSGKALEAYDRMLEQVQSRLRTVQETSMETLHEEIDKAIEAEQELQEMTRDELSLLGAYL
ncbi:MAG TPA: metalloendopeptidase, partial [Marinobacter sp.]|nr:metalloendopeptidase [Marinobacter sp.]